MCDHIYNKFNLTTYTHPFFILPFQMFKERNADKFPDLSVLSKYNDDLNYIL